MKKSISITGSTDGIGKLAAAKLAQEGHEVYLHGRSSVSKVIIEIKTMSGNENIAGFLADFSDLSEVRRMGEEVNSKISHLDVLINNAGIFKSPVQRTKAGFDIRFAVNYLAAYLLTEQTLPLMQGVSGARIINLSSAAQETVSIAALKGEKELSTNEAYAQSKLALTMWSFYLANKLKDINVMAVNPGSLLNTKMVNEAYGRYWSSGDKGADILFELAISAGYNEITGKYFDNDIGRISNAHNDAYDAEAINDLIEKTKNLVV